MSVQRAEGPGVLSTSSCAAAAAAFLFLFFYNPFVA